MKTLTCTCLLLLAGTAAGAAPVMYRFIGEAGQPVYSYTLPSGQAEFGYQKIDAETGEVIESVAPRLSPEKLAEKLRYEQAMQECRDELDRIYQLYGSERDVDRALETALKSLETRVTQLQANLRQASREQGRLQSQAADLERAGREVPRNLLDNLERTRSQIATLEGEIQQRHQEQDQARTRYRRDLERFRDGTCPEPGTVAAAP